MILTQILPQSKKKNIPSNHSDLHERMCLQRNVLGKGEFESDLDEITTLTPSPDFSACFENSELDSAERQSASARLLA